MPSSSTTYFIAVLAATVVERTFASPVTQARNICAANSYVVVPDNGTGTWPYRTYRTTNTTSPVFDVTHNGHHVDPNPIFMTVNSLPLPPGHGEHESGAYLMHNNGDLIWSSGNLSTSSNFRKQTLNGEPVLTYWRGTGDAGASGDAGHGYGEVIIMNTKLEVIHTICPDIDITVFPGSGATCVADIHESYISEQNTMIITVYNITTTDLTAFGGPKTGYVYNPMAVEVDIQTNEVQWSWGPLGQVPISDSHVSLSGDGQNASSAYDWFHMNSVQPYGRDHFLINSKNTWTSYLVDRKGSIVWSINGISGGDFGSLPEGIQYSYQHHARLHPSPYYPDDPDHVLLTYFADNNVKPSNDSKQSHGLGLLLDLPPSPANPPKLYSALIDQNDPVASFAEGSYEFLGTPNPNASVLLGYGIIPTFKEFSPNGTVNYSVDFGYRNISHSAEAYRVYKSQWHATPSAQLDLVVASADAKDVLTSCAHGASNRGYVSWNGATDVTGYRLLAGNDMNALTDAGAFGKKGFETEFVVPQDVKYVQVEALEEKRVVGKSAVVGVGASSY